MATYYVAHDGPKGDESGDSLVNAMSLQSAADTVTAGNEVRICATGAYNPGAAVDFDTNSGTHDAPIYFVGYDAAGTSEEMVIINGSGTGMSIETESWLRFRNLTVSGGTNGFRCNGAQFCEWYNCRTTGGTDDGWLMYRGQHNKYIKCEADNAGDAGFYLFSYNAGNLLVGCTAHDNTDQGFHSASATMVSCIAYDNDTDGFLFDISDQYADDETPLWWHCTSVQNDGDGFKIVDGTRNRVHMMNCIAARNGSYGLEASGAYTIRAFGNLWPSAGADANTAGATNNVTIYDDDIQANLAAGIADFVATADGSEDYRIGLSSAAKGAGWPGTLREFTSPATTGYPDIGAVQREEPAGNGGAALGPFDQPWR